MATLRSSEKLLNRNFVLLWQGQAVSQLGSHIATMAMVFWLKQSTGSASLIGLLMMASSIPRVILAGVAGALADRYSRRHIIIYSDVLRASLVLLLAGMLYAMQDHPETIISWMLVTAFGGAIIDSIFSPAITAAIPDIVPHAQVVKANSLRQLTGQLSQFLGQALGGTLFLLLGAPLLVLINALSFFFSALSETFIQIPQDIPIRRGTWYGQYSALKADIREGIRYVWTHAILKTLLAAAALFVFFTMPIIVLLPFYVEDYLEVTLDWYGMMLAVYGIGLAVGSLAAGLVSLPTGTRVAAIICFLVLNASTASLLTLVSSPFSASALIFGSGAFSGFNNTHLATIMQVTTPSHIRGRVFGFLYGVGNATAPLGMALGGFAFDLLGQRIPVIFISCSVIMIFAAVLLSMNREFRRFLTRQT